MPQDTFSLKHSYVCLFYKLVQLLKLSSSQISFVFLCSNEGLFCGHEETSFVLLHPNLNPPLSYLANYFLLFISSVAFR